MNLLDKEIFVSAAAHGTTAGYQGVYEWLTYYLITIHKTRESMGQPDFFMGQVIKAFAAFEAKVLQRPQTVAQFVEGYVKWYNETGRKIFEDSLDFSALKDKDFN